MPGVQYTGGNVQDYTLGRGIVSFDGDSPTLTLKGFRDMGNCTEFTVTTENEVKEHQSSLQGLKVTDLEVLQSQKMTVSFTLDEMNFKNLAIFMLGDPTGFYVDGNALINTSALASNDALLSPVNVFLVDATANLWYDLEVGVVPLGNALRRAYDFEAGQIVSGVDIRLRATTRTSVDGTLADETDYEIDRKMGRIRFKQGGLHSFAAGDNVQIKWSAPSVDKSINATAGFDDSLETIKALTKSGFTGRLRFIQENPTNSNHKTEYLFHSVTLKPEGDFSGISDEFTTITLTGTVSAVGTPPYGASQYLDITTRRGFSTP